MCEAMYATIVTREFAIHLCPSSKVQTRRNLDVAVIEKAIAHAIHKLSGRETAPKKGQMAEWLRRQL